MLDTSHAHRSGIVYICPHKSSSLAIFLDKQTLREIQGVCDYTAASLGRRIKIEIVISFQSAFTLMM